MHRVYSVGLTEQGEVVEPDRKSTIRSLTLKLAAAGHPVPDPVGDRDVLELGAPDAGIRPLCVYNPIHYQELPELFTRDALLKSDWYAERLSIKQERDTQLWTRHVRALEEFSALSSHWKEATRLDEALHGLN